MKALIRSFILTYLVLTCFISEGYPLLNDSTKKVDIKVIAKERYVNYDSIFNARRTDAAVSKMRLKKNPSAPATKNKKQGYSPKSTYSSPPVSEKNNTNITYKKAQAPSSSSGMADVPIENNSTTDVEKTVNKSAEDIVISNRDMALVMDSLNAATNIVAQETDTSKSIISKNGSVSKKVKDTFYYASFQMGEDKLVFLWAGCALMLIGAIAGLIFNRNAFIVSGVGAVFLLIGLYI